MLQISRAGLADIPKLTDIERQLFVSDVIHRRQFRYLLTKAKSEVIKVEEFGTLVGYMVLLKRRNSRKLRIYSLAVAPCSRKKGIANQLLDYAEKYGQCHQLYALVLEVCEKNERAIDLYSRAGFMRLERRENYYEDGCSALKFIKDIKRVEEHDSSIN